MSVVHPATGRVLPARILMTADTVGGVWSYAIELCRALSECNIEVALATMGVPLSSSQCAEAAQVQNLQIFESSFKLEWMSGAWRDVEDAGRWLLKLEQLVEPDLIHLNGYAHGNLAWNAPKVLVAHSCVLSWWRAVRNENAPAEWQRYRSEVTAGLNAADAVVAPTHSMLASLRQLYPWLGVGTRIVNGRSSEAFVPSGKYPFILCAGRLWDEAKNLDLVKCVASKLSWPVYAAGDCRHPDGGLAAAKEVRLLGQLEPQVLARWMAAAAIFVAPARYEPFGLSILEAALSRCALILGDISSLRENWNGAASFVPLDDPAELIDVIEDLISNRARREELGREARTRAMEFSRSRMLDGYLTVYSRLLDQAFRMSEEAAN
jgi:glycogen(starch) synthase